MHAKTLARVLGLLVFSFVCLVPSAAQQPCQPPTPLFVAREANIFTEEQEMFLGEAIAAQIQKDYTLLEDAALVAPLRKLGERLAKHLPPTKLRLQYFLVDLPEANAFVLPGGRIYVSRKLVAFVQSEDELAGVIAHELGHLVTRQQAIEMTRIWREVIGVTQVGDRQDIFEKYNRVVDNVARKPNAFVSRQHHDERQEELVADQIGLFALAAAGYDPQAQVKLFERFSEGQTKSSGFFASLFGVVRPEVKRIREMTKNFAALPPGCVEQRLASASTEFQTWQAAVLIYSGLGRPEVLGNLLSKTVLEPPLRGDVTHLRFSPDGKYVLAQDDAGINVLTRDPFAPLFRIHAPEAEAAQFTPDSQQVLFHTSDLRIEHWDIASRKLKEAQELVIRASCLQTALAPDGKTLACFDEELNLGLYDVATRAVLYQKKDFYTPDPFFLVMTSLLRSLQDGEAESSELELIKLSFSPDGRYFVAGARGVSLARFDFSLRASVNTSAVVFDLQTRAPLKLKGNVNKLIASGFAFLGPARLLVQNEEDPKNAGVLALPSGELVEQYPMFTGNLTPATRGPYVLLRPFKNNAVGVVDWQKHEVFKVHKNRALDLYEDVFVSESVTGELGLFDTVSNELKAKVLLPPSPLGRLRATAVSADFRWLAVSERTRGAVWDLAKGERVFHVRGFRGAYLAKQGVLLADFPKLNEAPRQIGRLNLTTRTDSGGPEVKESHARQSGPFVLITKPAEKGSGYFENVVLAVHEAGSLTQLWQRQFPKEAPRVWIEPQYDTLALAWPLASKAAELEIKSDPALAKQRAALKEKEGDYLVEVHQASNGNQRGKLLIETGKGSFRITNIGVARDWVVVNDDQNRVLIYSLATGEQRGRVFGSRTAVNAVANLLCVENERGQLTVYDLQTLQKREEFSFAQPVAYLSFNAEGTKLFVLTANQTVYWLNLGGAVPPGTR